MSRARLTLAVAAAVLMMAAAFLFTNDAWLRSLVESQVAARTGRTLNIGGDFAIDWSWRPRVVAKRVSLSNASWGSHPTMLEIERVEFTISLVDLLRGDLVLPQVALSHPWILLEFSAEGKRNWILEREQKRADDAPRIGRLTLDSGKLIYRNPNAQTDIALAIETVASAAEDARTQVEAKGVFRGLKASASGTGGPVLSLRDEELAYPLDVKAEIGATRASVRGEVTGLVALSKVDLDVKLQGAGLSELGKIIEISLPESPRYSVSGKLTRESDAWRFLAFKGALGKSDIAGEFLFERGQERPFVRAVLTSRQLIVDELPFMERRKDGKATPLQRLRTFDADIKLEANTVKREQRSIGGLSAHLKLDRGELKLHPLNFAAASGMVRASASMNVQDDPPSGRVEAKASGIELDALFLKSKPRGKLAGSAKLTGKGESLDAMIGSSEGDAQFVVSDGEISSLLVSFAGLDALGLFRSLVGERERIPVNCAVGDFDVKDGVMHTEVLVIDTTKTDIAGAGAIDLHERTYDLTFTPLEEEKGFFSKFLSGGAPVHLGGTFKNPEFTTTATAGAAARGGAAVALGIINPLAALIPLLAPASEKEANCAALISAVKTESETAPPRAR